jgi:energy-coupling factor transporter ATP-binding protein EcfA2
MSMTTLDNVEISAWLGRVAHAIDRGLREPIRGEAVAALTRGQVDGRLGLQVLTPLALLSDCLRVAHLAIEADGTIEPEELRRVGDLVEVAMGAYRMIVTGYDAFTDGAASVADRERFLRTHRADKGPFGHGAESPWPGLTLARLVEQHTRNAGPLRDHERMLARIMEVVFAGRSTETERTARRQLRELFEPPPSVGIDPRAAAFCREDAPEVFSSVAHGSQIHDRDPFDVESIHGEARELLHRLIERATIPEHHLGGQGRTLLLLGESGAGKTHLLRALRAQVHAQRHGYVGYLQMTSEVGDYSRYVLRNLIDSMERPYDRPSASESALMYLSDGLVGGRVSVPRDELERLRTTELTAEELDEAVGRVVDRVVRTEGLEELEVDLLHALLLLQRRDPALQRRVIRFLRCEPLTTYDRKLLGGLAAREQPEDPLRTITQLARIMYELHMAALVLMVDQLEETIPDGVTTLRIQQAFDALRAIADASPSAVVVISCLDDVYTAVRPRLARALVDRLEHEPPPIRLTSQRQPDEIELMLSRRLEHLYAAFDVPWREDDPIFPFTSAQTSAVATFRARDVLARFREYHAACIAEGRLIPTAESAPQPTPPSEQPFAFTAPVAPPAPEPDGVAEVERVWNDALSGAVTLPDDDEAVLALVESALHGVAVELGVALVPRRERIGSALRLVVDIAGRGRHVIALVNQRPQGGWLGKELDALKALANTTTVPIALRNSDFQFPPKSVTSQKVGALIAAGGRAIVLEERELRALEVIHQLASRALPSFDAWRRARRPLSSLAFLRATLDLDAAPLQAPTPAPPAAKVPAPPPAPPVAAAAVPPRRTSSPILVLPPDKIRIGVGTSMRAEPQLLALEQIKTHAAFLGTTGSGKTTAALNVIEQLLERGVSAVLVDRKGDLARYASDAWWNEPGSADAERRAALRQQIDISLFTPGNSQGRPLRLPLIPSMKDASDQERTQLATYAASGLAAMMGYGNSGAASSKRAVLLSAIQLNAGEREVTLDVLLDTVNRPDPELLRTVGSLQRFFASLGEDLQSLKINRGPLLAGEGEALDVAALLPPSGNKPRLTIIHTAALTDVPMLQFWVSRFLIELARLARRRPSRELQGIAFFDEADAYLPAVGSPPTKDPMLELLRRARSGGLGVLLATQNPGDFDYRGRDNIGTWLVGKVGQPRAIEKMRNLLGSYPNVAGRLANQPTGHFFVLSSNQAVEVRCDRAMMATEQLPEAEVVELARGTIQEPPLQCSR